MKRIKGEKCTLSDLKVGQSCKILKINIDDLDLKRHLLEMGLTTNTMVKVKKVAPLGEPMVVELFLEKHELKRISVEVL